MAGNPFAQRVFELFGACSAEPAKSAHTGACAHALAHMIALACTLTHIDARARHTIDSNSDGRIEFLEFAHALGSLRDVTNMDQKRRLIFKVYDLDGALWAGARARLCSHASVESCTRARVHVRGHVRASMCARVRMHARALVRACARVRLCVRVCTRALVCACVHARAQARPNTGQSCGRRSAMRLRLTLSLSLSVSLSLTRAPTRASCAGDGFVDRRELSVMIGMLFGRQFSASQVAAMVAAAIEDNDKDGDGKLRCVCACS